MLLLIGSAIVLLSVLGGFLGEGGYLRVLMQPWEWLIIVGAAVGAFLVANTKEVLKAVPGALSSLVKGAPYHKEEYLELLSLLYAIFRFIKTKGVPALESHIEDPYNSSIFSQFPKFMSHQHAVMFFCDYLRLLTMGTDSAISIEDLFEEELAAHEEDMRKPVTALQQMAEGLPALGIVAAVLGVINTMGAISEPPEVLGKLIGSALSGTFLGVLLSYGFVGPIGQGINGVNQETFRYLSVIKDGFLAHLKGMPPVVAVEFARKAIPSHAQPTFFEIEQALASSAALA